MYYVAYQLCESGGVNYFFCRLFSLSARFRKLEFGSDLRYHGW